MLNPGTMAMASKLKRFVSDMTRATMSSFNYNFNKSSPDQSVYYYQRWRRNWEPIMRWRRQRNNKRTVSDIMTMEYTPCLLLFINNNNCLTRATMSSPNYNNINY